jgi:hypothetical protein
MKSNFVSKRVIWSLLVGGVLVVGTYMYQSITTTTLTPVLSEAAVASAPVRVAIPVGDSDGNGLEDWRDELFTFDPVRVDTSATTSFVTPTTLTGQIGIEVVESMIASRMGGPLKKTDEEIITTTLQKYEHFSYDELFERQDISIIPIQDTDDALIRSYANAVATIIVNQESETTENEIDILTSSLETNNQEKMAELKKISDTYKQMRDEMLLLPVPEKFAKEHLDLTNTYHALHHDIEAMSQAFTDPARYLTRHNRYLEDARGLYLALQNYYEALLPHANIFTPEDPAVIFVFFSPEYNNS